MTGAPNGFNSCAKGSECELVHKIRQNTAAVMAWLRLSPDRVPSSVGHEVTILGPILANLVCGKTSTPIILDMVQIKFLSSNEISVTTIQIDMILEYRFTLNGDSGFCNSILKFQEPQSDSICAQAIKYQRNIDERRSHIYIEGVNSPIKPPCPVLDGVRNLT